MYRLSEKVGLIVPCYNEERRLDLERFKTPDLDCVFIFVNDGSNDKTLNKLTKNLKANMFCLNLPQNVGKAEAIREGMSYLKTLPIYDRLTWIGYWDADLATPLDELGAFLDYYGSYQDDEVVAVWGSRILRLGSLIERTQLRHYLGRVFATVSSCVLNLKCYDSQCGAKLFKKELIEAVFKERFISRWIFDIEILLRLKGYKIIEYPLKTWKDVPGSKIKFFSVSLRTLYELYKIKRFYHNRRPSMNQALSHYKG